jgi:anaerobic selenocysteine-containing dehydrogenase
MTQTIFCRSCDCLGHYTVEDQKLRSIQGSFLCEQAEMAFETEHRLSNPSKKEQKTKWTEALSQISSALKKVQKQNPNAIGLYVDDQTFRRGFDSVQSLFFALQSGSTSFYTDQCRYNAPRLLITELMIGHAASLISDLSRAHYILHLGSDHRDGSWGQLQPTMGYEAEIAHSRKTKGTKLIIVSSQKSEYAESADQFVSILPGTEPFLLLGMLQIALKSEWFDRQFVESYTFGFSELQSYLKDYPIERCAKICGIETSILSGLALKFTRSPMAIIHPNSGTFSNSNASLGAWAWFALHTISANALRPGGIYEHTGSIDLMPAFASVRTEQAPHSKSGNQPLLLLQNMGAQLLQDIEDSTVTHLIIAADDILYPQRKRIYQALQKLELLVVISEKETPLTKVADFVLPRTSAWEEDDILLHRNITLPFTALPVSRAISAPFAESRPLWEILRSLSKDLSFPYKKSDWGLSLRFFVKLLGTSTPEKWSKRLWSLLNENDLSEETSWNFQGKTNRAEWRVQDEKIQLCPAQLTEMFAAVKIPKPTEEYPFLLQSSNFLRNPSPNSKTKILVHSSTGFEQDAKVSVSSSFGTIHASVDISDSVHPQTIHCSFLAYPNILDLLPIETDAFSGTPVLNGTSCALQVL